MGEKFRKKALAGLAILIILFCIFSLYLFKFEPQREAVLFSFVQLNENAPNPLNYSNLQDKFNEPAFLENNTVTQLDMNYRYLEIVPKSNPDVVITLCWYQDEGFHFITEGYMLTGAFGAMGSYQELGNEMREEQTAVLEYIGQSDLAYNIEIEDYSYAAEPKFGHMFVFFAWLSLIILYVFLLAYRDGWLLANMKLIDTNVPIFFGVVSLYFSIGFGLMCAWATIANMILDERLICWIVPATFLIVGIYLIVAETKALAQ